MIARIGITIALVAVAFGAYAIGTRWQVTRLQGRARAAGVLAGLRPDVPGVVYFWSDSCAPCKLVQKPALEQLQADLGPDGVQVIAINALEQPDLADEWGVLSLPTTFIVDRSGQPRRVNHGVMRAEQLRQQIAELN
ncbi:MAG: thioredoxin family protein [Chloroflexota bacterium]|jgi:thiol-disulfide isomerase/thioredoxin